MMGGIFFCHERRFLFLYERFFRSLNKPLLVHRRALSCSPEETFPGDRCCIFFFLDKRLFFYHRELFLFISWRLFLCMRFSLSRPKFLFLFRHTLVSFDVPALENIVVAQRSLFYFEDADTRPVRVYYGRSLRRTPIGAARRLTSPACLPGGLRMTCEKACQRSIHLPYAGRRDIHATGVKNADFSRTSAQHVRFIQHAARCVRILSANSPFSPTIDSM